MPEVKTEPVKSTLVEEAVGAAAGAIAFYDRKDGGAAGFHFSCPCGCGSIGGVRLSGEHAWGWNGDRVRPTVTPSVALANHEGPHWHGFLTDGIWRSC